MKAREYLLKLDKIRNASRWLSFVSLTGYDGSILLEQILPCIFSRSTHTTSVPRVDALVSWNVAFLTLGTLYLMSREHVSIHVCVKYAEKNSSLPVAYETLYPAVTFVRS